MAAAIVLLLVFGFPEIAMARPSIWFAPLHPNDRPTGRGTADYFSLFDLTSPWRTVSKEISVFQIYLDILKRASDDEIRKLIAYLKANGIALAVETPVLADTA